MCKTPNCQLPIETGTASQPVEQGAEFTHSYASSYMKCTISYTDLPYTTDRRPYGCARYLKDERAYAGAWTGSALTPTTSVVIPSPHYCLHCTASTSRERSR